MRKQNDINRWNQLSEGDNRKLLYTGASIAALLMAAAMTEPNGWILAAAITNLAGALIKTFGIDLTHVTEE